jgi:hypothetical protein
VTCAAAGVHRRAVDAMVLAASNLEHDDGHTDCHYAGLLTAALDVILADGDAIGRARYAYLNAPPHGTKHDGAARLEHMRAAIRAAFAEEAA